jgi:hypothetical protein
MLSDIVTSKQAAIKDIRGAVFGLLIVIGAVVILNTINADIVNTSLTFNETTLTPAPPNEFENEMEAMCSSPDGCTIRTCIVAWSGCRTWCEDEMHGIVVVDGNFVDDCLTHNPRRFDCAIVPATPDVYDADGNIISPGNPSGFDCDAAEAQCESIDGDVTVLTSYVQCDAWDPGLAT